MSATAILAELHAAGITAHADGDRLRLDAGRGTLTPTLLSAVKSCKPDLLKMLRDRSLLLGGPGGSGSCSTDTVSSARAHYTTNSSKVDCEFNRFARTAVPTETGGWRNPEDCSAELAKQIRAGGIPWEVVEKSEADYAHLGRGEG